MDFQTESEVDLNQPAWQAKHAFFALGLAFAALVGLSAIFGLILGGEKLEQSESEPTVQLFLGLVQDISFVFAVIFVAASVRPVKLKQFGLNSFKAEALVWVLFFLFINFVFAVIYSLIFNPPSDDIPTQLGADDTTFLAIMAVTFIAVLAPFVEEFFFRGFFYKALSNSWGVLPAAVASGIVFGLIHFKLEYLVPLAFLGVLLALLYHRTGSLWPPIMLHGANNAIALIAYYSTL